jgi:amino acid transporter
MSISMFGTLSGQILNNPHVLFALANDKVLPVKALEAVHPKNNTYYFANITYAIIGFILATAGGFKQLAVIASASVLLVYLGVALSVIKLRKIQPMVAGTYRIPLGITVLVLAACTILYCLSHLKVGEKWGIIIFTGVVSVVYSGIRFIKK